MEIRTATADDARAVGELTVAAYRHAELLGGDRDRYADDLAGARERVESAVVLLAEEDRRTVGAVTLAPPGTPFADIARPGELEVRMLAVDPGLQRRGVAAGLMDAAADVARRHGLGEVVLSVERANAAAQAFYEHLGFLRVPERDWVIGAFELLVYHRPVPAAPTRRPAP